MINKKEMPEFLTKYLEYSATILNKSNGTIKEYSYDLSHFFRFLRYRYNSNVVPADTINPDKLSFPEIIKIIDISKLSNSILNKIQIDDIHAFLYYLKENYNIGPTTVARRISSIRSFFKYLTKITKIIEHNPTINLESPKIPKRLPVYLNLEESKRLIKASESIALNPKASDKNIERNTAIITLFLNCGIRLR